MVGVEGPNVNETMIISYQKEKKKKNHTEPHGLNRTKTVRFAAPPCGRTASACGLIFGSRRAKIGPHCPPQQPELQNVNINI